MQNGGFRDTVSHLDPGLTQNAECPLDINPADPVLLEQPGQRRCAQACGLGRGRRQRPQIEDPLGRDVLVQLEELRVVAPELLADAIAQAHALLLQLLSQARPFPQRDHGGVAGLDRPEQVRVGAQPPCRDPGIAPVVLGTRKTDAVTQVLELLGVDRVDSEAAVEKRIDHRPVWYLDGDCYRAWLTGGRHQPVAQGRQTGTAVSEIPLAHELTCGVEQADLVLLRAPIDTGKPAYGHDPCPPDDTSHHDACRSLYGRSKARLPTGHPSWPTRQGTVPSWCSRHRVDAGCSQRAGPPGELMSRDYQTYLEGTGWTPPDGICVPRWWCRPTTEGGVRGAGYHDRIGYRQAGLPGARGRRIRPGAVPQAPGAGEAARILRRPAPLHSG